MSHDLRRTLQEILAPSGVRLDGDRPWDPTIHDPRFYARVLSKGSLGLGESYMDGWWDCERVDQLIHRIQRTRVDRRVKSRPPWRALLRAKLLNLQAHRPFEIGDRHYDLGNDLFEAMLDRRMIYTGALWRDATDLDTAQERKLEWVARKLRLREGQRVLDIGCGWGGTARFLAERYGVEVVGVTVSKEQARRAREVCRGLPVEIRLCDYRDLDERFDRIVSLGMIEHVGPRNYATYFDLVRRCLAPRGLFVLQTIGATEISRAVDPWIERWIFPHAVLPTVGRLAAAFEGRMVMEDWENLGAHYDRTLMAWHDNVQRAWPRLRDHYDERFRRMWSYYLLACAGAFRARTTQLWQVVFSSEGVRGGYEAPGRETPVRAERSRELEASGQG